MPFAVAVPGESHRSAPELERAAGGFFVEEEEEEEFHRNSAVLALPTWRAAPPDDRLPTPETRVTRRCSATDSAVLACTAPVRSYGGGRLQARRRVRSSNALEFRAGSRFFMPRPAHLCESMFCGDVFCRVGRGSVLVLNLDVSSCSSPCSSPSSACLPPRRQPNARREGLKTCSAPVTAGASRARNPTAHRALVFS